MYFYPYLSKRCVEDGGANVKKNGDQILGSRIFSHKTACTFCIIPVAGGKGVTLFEYNFPRHINVKQMYLR